MYIINPEKNPVQKGAPVLPESDLPLLVVEGATDVLAGLDLGFTAVGRPSAMGGFKILRDMSLTGRTVWIIGENDAGMGKEGMDKCFYSLRDDVRTLVRVMPPVSVKDLRQWVAGGLTQKGLIEYVKQHGKQGADLDPNVFDDDTAFPIAERFLNTEFTVDSIPILRHHRGQWLSWFDGHYAEMTEPILRGHIYTYLIGKQYITNTVTGPALKLYKPTAGKIRDIMDALNTWCPVEADPPTWLNKDGIDPRNLIAFRNGLLDVREYLKGNVVLHDPDPAYFSMCVFPYNFNPDLSSELLLPTLRDLFNNDESVIDLLQEWSGYICTPDMSYEKMMLFTGRTRCGKGTVMEMLISMLGREQCISTDFQSLASQFGRVPLVGKLAATLGDAKTPRRGEADAALETVLRVVGRDPIQIRPLYHQGYDAYLSTRFIIAMNGLPAFTDQAKALASRMNIIEFPNCYEGREDITIKPRLAQDAAEGKIIPWALEGLKKLRQRGRFKVPDSSKESLQDLVSITSPISTFVDECCLLGDQSKTTSTQMVFEAWQHWCGENGKSPGGNTVFKRNLTAECPSVDKRRTAETGRKEYEYTGMALQPWVYGKYLGRPE